MRRIRMVIEYDGTALGGFQSQGAGGNPTVQSELEDALSRLLVRPIRTTCAGRTDAGVHALGQVITFDTDSDRSLNDLVRGANALLIPDIRVILADEVGADFHPRFSARARLYHYYLMPECRRELFFRDRVWALRWKLDLEAMREAARQLLGAHDFSAYCRGVPPHETRKRDLYRLDIVPLELPDPTGLLSRFNGLVCVQVEANAFLRRMVRMLVAGLVLVGRGEWAPGRPRQVLDARDPEQGAGCAPARGLYLVSVDYDSQRPRFRHGRAIDETTNPGHL